MVTVTTATAVDSDSYTVGPDGTTVGGVEVVEPLPSTTRRKKSKHFEESKHLQKIKSCRFKPVADNHLLWTYVVIMHPGVFVF